MKINFITKVLNIKLKKLKESKLKINNNWNQSKTSISLLNNQLCYLVEEKEKLRKINPLIVAVKELQNLLFSLYYRAAFIRKKRTNSYRIIDLYSFSYSTSHLCLSFPFTLELLSSFWFLLRMGQLHATTHQLQAVDPTHWFLYFPFTLEEPYFCSSFTCFHFYHSFLISAFVSSSLIFF